MRLVYACLLYKNYTVRGGTEGHTSRRPHMLWLTRVWGAAIEKRWVFTPHWAEDALHDPFVRTGEIPPRAESVRLTVEVRWK